MDDETHMTKIGTVYTLGIWTVKPGNEAVFIKTWNDFAQWTSMNQKGAQIAVLVQDAEDSQKFISFGPWQDKEAALQWRNTMEFKRTFGKFREICSEIQPHTILAVASTDGRHE
jgi:heme-degrading monooxygenase HmoA